MLNNQYQQKRLHFSQFNGKKSEVKLLLSKNLTFLTIAIQKKMHFINKQLIMINEVITFSTKKRKNKILYSLGVIIEVNLQFQRQKLEKNHDISLKCYY